MKLSLQRKMESASLHVRYPCFPIPMSSLNPIIGFHTNTERGYLSTGMRPRLQEILAEEWGKVTEAEKEGKQGFDVIVSTADKDPYEIV